MSGATAAQSLMDALLKDSVRKRKQEKTPPQAAASGPLPRGAMMEAIMDVAQGSGMVYAKHPIHGYVQIGCARNVTINHSIGSLMTADIEIVLRMP